MLDFSKIQNTVINSTNTSVSLGSVYYGINLTIICGDLSIYG